MFTWAKNCDETICAAPMYPAGLLEITPFLLFIAGGAKVVRIRRRIHLVVRVGIGIVDCLAWLDFMDVRVRFEMSFF